MFMQLITAISISLGQPTMLPSIIIVIGVTMVKDGYEDYKRHKADKAENQATVLTYDRVQCQFVER